MPEFFYCSCGKLHTGRFLTGQCRCPRCDERLLPLLWQTPRIPLDLRRLRAA